MKAKLTFVMLAVMILFSAAPAYAIDYVVGQVTYNGQPLMGASVNATCDGQTTSNTVITSGSGSYVLEIVCSAQSTVEVNAVKGDLHGSQAGTMENWVAVNVAIVDDIIMTPEFGLIAIPLLLSMAGFVFMKGRM